MDPWTSNGPGKTCIAPAQNEALDLGNLVQKGQDVQMVLRGRGPAKNRFSGLILKEFVQACSLGEKYHNGPKGKLPGEPGDPHF